MGGITASKYALIEFNKAFPPPCEVNGDFYYTDKDVSKLTGISFPYPYEGNRGSYAEKLYSIAVSRFGFRTLSR